MDKNLYLILDEKDLNYQGLNKWKMNQRIDLCDLRLSRDVINKVLYIFLILQDGCIHVLKNKYPLQK